jgi:TRAP-type C4-dicarboxylate transport system permease small subunit
VVIIGGSICGLIGGLIILNIIKTIGVTNTTFQEELLIFTYVCIIIGGIIAGIINSGSI